MFTGIGEKETQISSLLPWNAQRAIMSNIAPYNEKKEEEKKEANNEPKRTINEMQTETREEKNEKINTCRGFRDSFNVRVFSPFFCISNSSTQRSYRPTYHSFNGSHDN